MYGLAYAEYKLNCLSEAVLAEAIKDSYLLNISSVLLNTRFRDNVVIAFKAEFYLLL